MWSRLASRSSRSAAAFGRSLPKCLRAAQAAPVSPFPAPFSTMATSFVGAIDQGTTSSRFIAFDHSGNIAATHQLEHKQIYQQPGWCEHDADEITRNVEICVREALAKGGIELSQLQAIGITNQRETALIWDRVTGKPLYNAIVWHDTRTTEIVHRLKNGEGEGFLGTGGDRFRAVTGLPIATYFSAVKIMWMLENVPGLRAKAEAGDALFGNMDTWLIWKLSGGVDGGVHVTDVTNASRTNLMRLDTLQWDDDILKCLNIPRAMLPSIRSSSEVYASGHKDSVVPGIPIAGDLGDQQAALFGQACYTPGEAKNTVRHGLLLHDEHGHQAHSLPPRACSRPVGYKIGRPACRVRVGGLHLVRRLARGPSDHDRGVGPHGGPPERARLQQRTNLRPAARIRAVAEALQYYQVRSLRRVGLLPLDVTLLLTAQRCDVHAQRARPRRQAGDDAARDPRDAGPGERLVPAGGGAAVFGVRGGGHTARGAQREAADARRTLRGRPRTSNKSAKPPRSMWASTARSMASASAEMMASTDCSGWRRWTPTGRPEVA
ncbi:hypothetical protein ON010_g2921 [Phytophthora cinnamomi]|nr:hypothetical protein ON010_g2921 [Phytophthora cinnamomi]